MTPVDSSQKIDASSRGPREESGQYRLQTSVTESFINDLRHLSEMPDEFLSKLLEIMKKYEPGKFGQNKEKTKEVEDLILKCGLQVEKVNNASDMLDFLNKVTLDRELDTKDLLSQLEEIGRSENLSFSKQKLKLINSIIEPDKEALIKHKATPFIYGNLPVLKGFTSVQDIRTVRNKHGDDYEIVSFVPISVIRLSTDDDQDQRKEILFQATISGLRNLIERLENETKMLEKMIDSYKGEIPIYRGD